MFIYSYYIKYYHIIYYTPIYIIIIYPIIHIYHILYFYLIITSYKHTPINNINNIFTIYEFTYSLSLFNSCFMYPKILQTFSIYYPFIRIYTFLISKLNIYYHFILYISSFYINAPINLKYLYTYSLNILLYFPSFIIFYFLLEYFIQL
jgi:hypothetical protein